MSPIVAAAPDDAESGSDFLVGPDSQTLLEQYLAAEQHFIRPVTRVPLRSIFEELAATWREETFLLSSLDEIILHPAYQRIIGFGPRVIPLIVRELAREPNHWFWALQQLTGVDPVLPQDRGDLDQMTAAWLDWARQRGYLA